MKQKHPEFSSRYFLYLAGIPAYILIFFGIRGYGYLNQYSNISFYGNYVSPFFSYKPLPQFSILYIGAGIVILTGLLIHFLFMEKKYR